MQSYINTPATPPFGPEPLLRVDPEPNQGPPSDLDAEESFRAGRLARFYHSVFPDSFVA